MNNVQDFWIGLSDFWTSFENRKEIENFWQGMLNAFEETSSNLYKIFLTTFQEYSFPIWEEKYQSIECIVNGASKNSIPGTEEYYLPENMIGTYSIPTLKGIETGQVLTEGVDYNILGCDRISFSTVPSPGPNSDKVTLFADTSKKIDGTVFNMYRKIANIELLLVEQQQYHPFTFDGDTPATLTDEYKDEKAILIKYMSWALMYLRKQIPTITNLKKLYNVLFNLPFAYEGGEAVISGNTCTIGNYTYYITSGNWAFNTGDTVNRFDPLTNSVIIYDRYNNKSLINSTFPELQEASSMIVNVTLESRSNYLQAFIDDYTNNHANKGMNILYDVH